MIAHVFPVAAWYEARAPRAKAGKAPRLAVVRMIVLRQQPNGDWSVAVYGRRFGVWSKPQWLGCGPYKDARRILERAWQDWRLPIVWAYRDDKHARPFCFDAREPTRGAA